MRNHDSTDTNFAAIERIRQAALDCNFRIVITDGEDERVIEAVDRLCSRPQQKNIQFVLLGNEQQILGHKLPEQVIVRNPTNDPNMKRFAEIYRELRVQKKKTVTVAEAEEKMRENEYFGAFLVRSGYADGMLGGSSIPTAKVLRAGIEVIGMNAHTQVVSGSFFMFLPRPLPGGQQVLVLADCAVVPEPNFEQLADIALATVQTTRRVMEMEPVVAFVSFSTKGSANYAGITKLTQALSLFRERAPDIRADGELQIDAALVPEICHRKDPTSSVNGQANVLIFPDLNSGNIAYKLVERVGGAKALGVVLSGFHKPVNDLSRGCSVDDIMDMICVTALQTQGDPSTELSGGIEA